MNRFFGNVSIGICDKEFQEFKACLSKVVHLNEYWL